MLIGGAIDSIGNHDYLTREESRLFFWRKIAKSKLHRAKGLENLQQKQKKPVMYMLDLFLNLMLDTDENLPERCFLKVSSRLSALHHIRGIQCLTTDQITM